MRALALTFRAPDLPGAALARSSTRRIDVTSAAETAVPGTASIGRRLASGIRRRGPGGSTKKDFSHPTPAPARARTATPPGRVPPTPTTHGPEDRRPEAAAEA